MTIRQLWEDKESLVEVRKFLTTFLTETGVKKMFSGEDTKAVGEAKDILDKAFDELDDMFGPKKKKKEIKNQAR